MLAFGPTLLTLKLGVGYGRKKKRIKEKGHRGWKLDVGIKAKVDSVKYSAMSLRPCLRRRRRGEE